jgi:hypothetical protein
MPSTSSDDGADELVADAAIGGSTPGGRPAPAETAAYIADLATELTGMARAADLGILAYLLDIVRLEAETNASKLANASRG